MRFRRHGDLIGHSRCKSESTALETKAPGDGGLFKELDGDNGIREGLRTNTAQSARQIDDAGRS